MAIGIIRFPGSNCDRDVYKAIELAGGEAEYIWWNNEDLTDYDGIVIPGGFSYGDYLRAGAIASNTPVINGVKALVKEEKPWSLKSPQTELHLLKTLKRTRRSKSR